MAEYTGCYVGLPVNILTAKLTLWLSVDEAVANGHQSYSIAGRAFTRADLPEVRKTIGEYNYALQLATGSLRKVVYADMSNS